MLVLLGLVLTIAPTTVYAQEKVPEGQPTLDELFSVKEYFKYEVKYGFFKLGEVEVELYPDTMYNGRMHKHIVTRMISNPRVPFMDEEDDKYHSLFYENEQGFPVTSYYWKDNLDENAFKTIEYKFNRDSMFVSYKEDDNTRDTLDLVEPATAGHIIFYFSRLFAGSDEDLRLPVYVTKEGGFINLENPSKLEKRNYKPWDEPVNAYLSQGTTEDISGPFGFSGNFRAWFKDDDLRIPLEARVKVFLGNAIIRIIEYRVEEL